MKINTRPVYISLGYISLALGVIGVFLPIMPTAPFIILAAFFFSKSSIKLHRWLRQHRIFGAPLRDWENHQVIRTKHKIIATLAASTGLIYPLFFATFANEIKMVVVGTIVLVFIFIWTRPSNVATPAE